MKGSIYREGNLVVGEGEAGLQMQEDIMKLAISRTINTTYTIKAGFLSLCTLAAGFGAYESENKALSVLAGGLGILAIQQGISAYKSRKQYRKDLDEAGSHSHLSRKELQGIDSRYL